MADPKYAMPDGSYPINSCADVSDAAKLAHNSKTYSFDEIKAHVMKAKNALGCGDDVLPDTWKEARSAMGEQPEDKETTFARLQGTVYRAIAPDFEVLEGDGANPILSGHFAVYDEWGRVESRSEGTFMERIAPGAFTKTLKENRSSLQVLFQHGMDPNIGAKPLGTIRSIKEDAKGVAYEVDLLDTSYTRELIPGLRAGLYGASFSGKPVKDDVVSRPQRSAHNPEGIPEVTVREWKLVEFGPGIMPVYAGASAGVRSMTDEVLFARFAGDPERLRQLLAAFAPDIANALSARAEEAPHSKSESREPVAVAEPKFRDTGEWLEWLSKI
jgi:HK97 family phage prohead protease